MAEKKDWISGAVKRPGALRAALKVPAGKNIPASKLAEAARSKNPRMRRMASLAETFKHMRHK
jgi:hypothetical protein